MFCYIKSQFSCIKSLNFNVQMASTRVRAFCFTLNNPTEGSEQLLESIPNYSYLTFGREIGAAGTPHLQGYIRFVNGKSMSAARKLLVGCHIEAARTITEAIDYCHKDGNFAEFGIRPKTDVARGEDEIARWQQAWDLAKESKIEDIPVDIRVRCYGTLRRIEKDYMGKRSHLPAPCGIWLYGESGVGKTKTVYDQYPELYSKNASKWWDGYQDQDVVLFDDMDPEVGKWSGRFLKIWADQYPFIADVKGGSVSIRPKQFIVTSQYTIEECYGDAQTRLALNRRFRVVNKLERDDIVNLQ